MKDAAVKSESRFAGLAVSRGVGVGQIVIYSRSGYPSIAEIQDLNADTELDRFRGSVRESTEQIRTLIDAGGNSPLADILNIQLLILEQSSFVNNVEREILRNSATAEQAIAAIADRSSQRQSLVADPHLREKHLDIEDLAKRLIGSLNGPHPQKGDIYSGAIVVAHELRPSEVIELSRRNPAGLLTERGGWTSHSSILAREFRIPMVSGLRELIPHIGERDHAVVDGETGTVIINPSSETVRTYEAGRNCSRNGFEGDGEDASAETTTLDGVRIVIRANVDIPEAYQLARQKGAEGIGLFRSESLISRPGAIPDEEEQTAAYRRIASAAGDHGVIIRTFDIGLDRVHADGHDPEVNPSLGLRSIRLSLRYPEIFREQIRAILRAGADHKIDIVLPMVAGVAEVREAAGMIADEVDDLAACGAPCGSPRIGAMIEVPSGVLTADHIAAEVDFLALGTNDLVQYLLAVDRDNDSVADWYQTLHPAVISSIKSVVAAAENNRVPLVICGEMAGSPFYAPLLLALGARELSMNINSISRIRRLISRITLSEVDPIVEVINSCATASEIENNLREYYLSHWPGLFSSNFFLNRNDQQ